MFIIETGSPAHSGPSSVSWPGISIRSLGVSASLDLVLVNLAPETDTRMSGFWQRWVAKCHRSLHIQKERSPSLCSDNLNFSWLSIGSFSSFHRRAEERTSTLWARIISSCIILHVYDLENPVIKYETSLWYTTAILQHFDGRYWFAQHTQRLRIFQLPKPLNLWRIRMTEGMVVGFPHSNSRALVILQVLSRIEVWHPMMQATHPPPY